MRWPFRVAAALIALAVLVAIWPAFLRSGMTKRLVMLGVALLVLAGPYLWLALGGGRKFDRWVAARLAARKATTPPDS